MAPLPPPRPKVRGVGMTIAGFSVFGVSYLISALSASIAIDSGDFADSWGRPLLIPAVGPFISSARVGTATGAFGLIFLGIVQTGSLAMGVTGAVLIGKSKRQARLATGPGGLKLEF